MSTLFSLAPEKPRRVIPEEIQVAIVQQTPSYTLPALARVCQSFYRCVTPRLYRVVHYLDAELPLQRNFVSGGSYTFPCSRFPIWAGPHQQCTRVINTDDPYHEVPPQSSRIFHLAPFINTITKYPALRHQIDAASFQWDAFEAETPEMTVIPESISVILDLLAPSLERLHFSPSLWCGNGELGLGFPSITSLNLPFNGLSDSAAQRLRERERLYQTFRMPALRSLSFAELISWPDFQFAFSPSNRSATSNVVSLSFAASLPNIPDLREILTWPKALKSFRCQEGLDPMSLTLWDDYDARIFRTIVEPQRTTLEELFIIRMGALGRREPNFHGALDLRDFPLLKRLGIPREMTTSWKDLPSMLSKERVDSPPIDDLNTWTLPAGSQGFPRALEELQIEMDPEFSWQTYLRHESGQQEPEHVATVSRWLCKIAEKKQEQYPQLKKLVLWKTHSGECYEVPWVSRLTQHQECSEVLEAFKSADIEVYWIFYNQPPLFSG